MLRVEEQTRTLLKGYSYDYEAQRFRDNVTGRFVSRRKITSLLEQIISRRESQLQALVQLYLDGGISPSSWLSSTRHLLQRQYLQSAALGAGGWDRMTPMMRGRIADMLRLEYGRLANFAADIQAGRVTAAQAANRMQMYMGNARKMFFFFEQEVLPDPDSGTVYIEKRNLDPAAKSCPDCVEYHDLGWQLLGALPLPSDACRCFPGDTLVVSSEIDTAYNRHYSGELVEITTSLGNKLSATPNHPVATCSGWAAIGSIKEGDKVLYNKRIYGSVGGEPNKENIPTPIKDIYDSISYSSSGITYRRAGLSVDFHGDGGEQEIYIVRSENSLSDGDKPFIEKELVDLFFSCSRSGKVSRSCLISSCPFVTLRDDSSFHVASKSNSVFSKNAFYRVLRSFVLRAKFIKRSSIFVLSRNFLAQVKKLLSSFVGLELSYESILTEASPWDSVLSKNASDNSSSNPVFLREGKLGVPPNVLSDDFFLNSIFVGVDTVVSTRRYFFDGHVFNLSTYSGNYTANNLIVQNCDGNCRCDMDRVIIPADTAANYIGTRKSIQK